MIAFILALSIGVLPGEAQFTLGNSQANDTQYADAIATYQHVAEIDPSLAPYAKICAAKVRAQAGDTAGAISELNIIIAADTSKPWLRKAEYELAKILHKQKRYEEAAKHYAPAIQSEVDLWWMDDIRWEAAENLLEIPGQRAQGLNYFGDIVENTRWYYRRLKAARMLQDSERAEDRIKASLGLLRCRKYDEAKTVAASIPTTWLTEPHLQRQWEHLSARILIARGMRTEGNKKLKELAETYPEGSWADTALLYTVISLISDEKLSDAERVKTQLIRLYPNSEKTGESMLRLARAYAKFDHIDQSINGYRAYIKRFGSSPKVASVLLEAGDVYRKANRDQEAIGMYEQLAENLSE